MRGTCGFPSLRQCVHASVLGCDTLDGKGIGAAGAQLPDVHVERFGAAQAQA